jgi:hypothetical protein
VSGARQRLAPLALAAQATLTALATVIALAAVACGGGGGGTGPTGPPPPTSSIVFTPTGGGNPLLATGAGTQGSDLALELRTTGIQDLYGLAFHLTYPAAAMRFVGAAQGSVLNGGGSVRTSFQVVDSPVGNLVIGLSRLGTVTGTAAGGTLMTLQFAGVASGTGNLAFGSNQANDSLGNAIPGLTWSAGTVQVTIVARSR